MIGKGAAQRDPAQPDMPGCAGTIKQNAKRPNLTLTPGWSVAMKKPVPGVLSGMDFLLPRMTRKRQRWRDGEGAFGSCLRRDVAAINKMHFC